MAKHGVDRYFTDSEHNALVALAWHDIMCDENCPERPEHASQQNVSVLNRFLVRLADLETQEALEEV